VSFCASKAARAGVGWATVAWLGEPLRSQLRGAREALTSVLFPAPCRLCGQPLDTAGAVPFCRACVDSLRQTLSEPLCHRCGRPIVSGAVAEAKSQPLCHFCRGYEYAFDLARSFGPYATGMARAILLLKYANLRPLGPWFAQRLFELTARNPGAFEADMLVPVPLDRSRTRERGYNQAELIAKPLARLLHIPFRSCVLVRTRPRPNQLRLTRRERWETVRGAYATHYRAQVDKLRVLLLDDVFTTGATLNACSEALKGAGAARVVGLTVARALSLSPGVVAVPQDWDLGE
jgi:ComF family protein